jgi:hypothetical protein
MGKFHSPTSLPSPRNTIRSAACTPRISLCSASLRARTTSVLGDLQSIYKLICRDLRDSLFPIRQYAEFTIIAPILREGFPLIASCGWLSKVVLPLLRKKHWRWSVNTAIGSNSSVWMTAFRSTNGGGSDQSLSLRLLRSSNDIFSTMVH